MPPLLPIKGKLPMPLFVTNTTNDNSQTLGILRDALQRELLSGELSAGQFVKNASGFQ